MALRDFVKLQDTLELLRDYGAQGLCEAQGPNDPTGPLGQDTLELLRDCGAQGLCEAPGHPGIAQGLWRSGTL